MLSEGGFLDTVPRSVSGVVAGTAPRPIEFGLPGVAVVTLRERPAGRTAGTSCDKADSVSIAHPVNVRSSNRVGPE
jgi:hypothetical protein